jgi:hypothetical protein
MRLEAELKPWPSTSHFAGTLAWDSETGEIGGTLAGAVREAALEAKAWGKVPAGPQFAYEYPIADPFHRPDELAAILQFMEFELPAELASQYHPDFPDPLEGMSAAQRRATDL